MRSKTFRQFSTEFKLPVVEVYLAGEGSLTGVAEVDDILIARWDQTRALATTRGAGWRRSIRRWLRRSETCGCVSTRLLASRHRDIRGVT
jgi:hypothetical protein